MSLCKSRNIVTYDETFLIKGSLFIVMELMDGGSLYVMLKNLGRIPLTEVLIAYILREILRFHARILALF